LRTITGMIGSVATYSSTKIKNAMPKAPMMIGAQMILGQDRPKRNKNMEADCKISDNVQL